MEDQKKESLINRFSTVGVSVFCTIIGALLIILNFTVLPVFGILFGVLLVVLLFGKSPEEDVHFGRRVIAQSLLIRNYSGFDG